MTTLNSDALVFFGATGDLAYKQIFPALYAMFHRDGLDIPIIGMARPGWTIEKLTQRARESVECMKEPHDVSIAKADHQVVPPGPCWAQVSIAETA